jgi:hypothetical protein
LSRKEDVCPCCGKSIQDGRGLEQFLERLGITEDMINNLKGDFQNVDIDEYLQTAHDYLSDEHSSSAGRVVLFPTEDGILDRRQLEDAITHAMAKK